MRARGLSFPQDLCWVIRSHRCQGRACLCFRFVYFRWFCLEFDVTVCFVFSLSFHFSLFLSFTFFPPLSLFLSFFRVSLPLFSCILFSLTRALLFFYFCYILKKHTTLGFGMKIRAGLHDNVRSTPAKVALTCWVPTGDHGNENIVPAFWHGTSFSKWRKWSQMNVEGRNYSRLEARALEAKHAMQG